MKAGSKVEFDCALFRRMPGGYFRLSPQTQEPVYVVAHGGVEFTLPFRGIRKEFAIAEGSRDDAMLERIAEALQFVSALRPGDDFPPEMIDRKASWEPSEQDRRYAQALVRFSLIKWHRREPMSEPGEPMALVMMMDEPSMRTASGAAIEALVEALGLADAKAVRERMAALADEIAHCECIFRRFRDGFSLVESKLSSAMSVFRRDRTVSDQIGRCLALLDKAKQGILTEMMAVAANYGEVVPLLASLENSLAFLRDARDREYKTFRVWEDLFQKWQRSSVVDDRSVLGLIEETYRFLAPRYAPIQEWVTFLTDQRDRKKRMDVVEW